MPVSIIIGGQYGSEGKGKISDFWAKRVNATAVIRVGGPNSGHTVYTPNGGKMAFTQLPTSCIRNDILSILPAGSYIDIQTLKREIQKANLSPDRLAIDFNAVIVDSECTKTEANLLMRESIGSTLSGTGQAISKRVMRRKDVILAENVPYLSPFITDTKALMRALLNNNHHIIIEGTQGYGLSNLHSQADAEQRPAELGEEEDNGLYPFQLEQLHAEVSHDGEEVAEEAHDLPIEPVGQVVHNRGRYKVKEKNWNSPRFKEPRRIIPARLIVV